jgi:hypothetical protein
MPQDFDDAHREPEECEIQQAASEIRRASRGVQAAEYNWQRLRSHVQRPSYCDRNDERRDNGRSRSDECA